MNPRNQAKLRRDIAAAGSAAIAKNGYVTAIDVLLGTGWVRPEKVEDWRRGWRSWDRSETPRSSHGTYLITWSPTFLVIKPIMSSMASGVSRLCNEPSTLASVGSYPLYNIRIGNFGFSSLILVTRDTLLASGTE